MYMQNLTTRIAELEGLGLTIHVIAIDLSRPNVYFVLAQAIHELNIPPVRGVFHGAGTAGYHTLKKHTLLDMGNVLAPKGSWWGVGMMVTSMLVMWMLNREMEASGIAAISKEEALNALD
ncbi:uncharacterized protein P174DRAFT_435983 [Aspergillus novofumigatus IBT 16806]|uniref:Ketoreductase (KR) domain-containing protein n=1 Tax=Aspergillus novofumigatus (strain IBT 16806) TaxID=1392255 RepID=A0A2I1BTZ6_ASPN1|nr:uncharacterized protein P174DRAFT_435983 [Aspergillus novofumigatus IBT 16806]PKX88814.1 hypothetical protein P174DRAFT_435983 [Aspergillus novofumigatus IBT 16806]